MLPTPSERKVSCGQATLAMILNGLGFTGRALYLMPEYMENKPVGLLISEELVARDFNDDTLGRSLDELFQAGITELFAQVAQDAVATYQLDVAFAHTDTSSFSLSGQYESEVAKEAEAVRGAVKITHGYSKDHRPDLKQVVVTLITSQKGRIPLWLEALAATRTHLARVWMPIAVTWQMRRPPGLFWIAPLTRLTTSLTGAQKSGG
jgi:transposase